MVVRERLLQLVGKVMRCAAVLAIAGVLLAACGSSTSSRSQSTDTALPAACPQNGPVSLAPTRRPGAQNELAPAGVRAIRVCLYAGVNASPPMKLEGSRLLTSSQLVRRLVADFDKLPSFPKGAVSCPMDDGSQILALLAYPDGPPVTISVGLSGCATVTNGSVKRTAMGFGTPRQFGPQLLAQLKQLVG